MNRTRQELFDKNWEHFIVNQEPRAIAPLTEEDGSRCRYQVPGTHRRCAIGILIPDEQISQWEEVLSGIVTASVHRIKLVHQAFGEDITDDDIHFLSDLQTAHDLSEDISIHKKMLLHVAEQWNLTLP